MKINRKLVTIAVGVTAVTGWDSCKLCGPGRKLGTNYSGSTRQEGTSKVYDPQTWSWVDAPTNTTTDIVPPPSPDAGGGR